MKINPFKYAGPLSDKDIFVDRETEIRKIIEYIARCQPVAIYGERRIGKTSLLHRLKKELPKENVHYLSLEEVRDEDEFLKWLARAVALEGWESPLDFVPALEKKRPILLLDEFDKAAFSDHFSGDFFGLLRAWASQSMIRLVIASKRRPAELMRESENMTSPFYNIFVSFQIGPVDLESAEEILAPLKEKAQDWDHLNWVARVIETSGFLPWKVQLFGSLAWEALAEQETAAFDPVWQIFQDKCRELSSEMTDSGPVIEKSAMFFERPASQQTVWQKIPAAVIAGLVALASFLAMGGVLSGLPWLLILSAVIFLASIVMVLKR